MGKRNKLASTFGSPLYRGDGKHTGVPLSCMVLFGALAMTAVVQVRQPPPLFSLVPVAAPAALPRLRQALTRASTKWSFHICSFLPKLPDVLLVLQR